MRGVGVSLSDHRAEGETEEERERGEGPLMVERDMSTFRTSVHVLSHTYTYTHTHTHAGMHTQEFSIAQLLSQASLARKLR